MATATIYPTNDGFLNNVSGWYGMETDNLCRSTSSSDADYCELYTKFTTVGAGIGASDTINSVTFYINVWSYSDPFAVGGWQAYTDTTPVWGAWNQTTPPSVSSGMDYGTVDSGFWNITGTGWWNKAISTSISKSGIFSVGVKARLGDIGPAQFTSYNRDHATNKPYVVIDYTPASTSHLLAMTGVGK